MVAVPARPLARTSRSCIRPASKSGRLVMAGAFDGKVVTVSGGGRGIGRAIAMAFAREGAQTVLAASNAANLDATAKEIADGGAPMPLALAGDLRTLAGCEALFAAVKDRFGRCDALVNNAGATKGGNFFDLPDEAWADGFALKFFGAVRLTRLFWPLLKEAHGSVLFIDGGAARTPGADFLIGGSVNAAMANFAKGLAALGNRDDVNVNVIHPGPTETDRMTELFAQFAKAQGKTPDEVRRDGLQKSGARRMGLPEDIAALAVFLCRDVARHIQGQAIAVDGGTQPGYY
ncbi:MAG: SDR family oxidoreductase [Pseudolabrys sp.]